jgi:disulfide bond formation protein DsbB
MLSRTLINRLIILGYMVLVGFSLAKSIQSGSKLGFVLALLGLGAGIYFLYLLVKANEESASESES